MGAREELEEDCGVDRKITTYAKGPQRSEATDSSEIRTASCYHTEYSCDSKSEVEGPFATEDITAKAPEHSTGKQANVLSQREERRSIRAELVCDRSEDQ